MNHYRIHIPQSISVLFFSLIKKERIHRSLLITPTSVLIRTPEGRAYYTHNTEISEPCSFVFPFEITVQPSSDMSIEWETDIDEDGETYVKNARYIFSEVVIDAGNVPCENKTFSHLPSFRPFPRPLAAAIPHLSKCAEPPGTYFSGRTFPGIVFTNRSAFATDGKKFAAWTDTSPTSEVCPTTSAILTAYLDTYAQFLQETKTAAAALYEECINNPQEHLDFFESVCTYADSYSPESLLEAFQEQFPDLETFVNDNYDIPDKTPTCVPIAFPKYLEKILTQDTCSYGFAIDYPQGSPVSPNDSLPDAPKDISFFLSTSTYAGRKLPGQLTWCTTIDASAATNILLADTLLFQKHSYFDDTPPYTISTPAFSAIQRHAKKFTRHEISTSGIAFVNHNGKLGIGNLLNHEIHSTPTALPLPAGIEQYIVAPTILADIQIPTYLPSITFTFDELNLETPVRVSVGNITYLFARIEKPTSKDGRVLYPIHFQDTPLSIPPISKLNFSPTVIK